MVKGNPATGASRASGLQRMARWARAVPGGQRIVAFARLFFGNGGPDGQWQRIVMNRHVRDLVDALDPKSLDVLEISGSNWPLDDYFHTHRSVSWPQFDICKDRLDDKFDLIIAEQVFEHLPWPYRAAKNVHAMLKPGGAFLISTPFMIPIHECPLDCTRWTPTGMKHFLAECGFPIDQIQMHAWGNLRCVKANLKRWQIYLPWFHSLHNESRYPVQVWALARTEQHPRETS